MDERKVDMAKLYFRYGAMGASKTANALMTRYNYQERHKNAVLCKPQLESRDGKKKLKSRIGLESDVAYIEDILNDLDHVKQYDCIIVDEAQFLTATQVDTLSTIVDVYGVPVICYGLKTDFQSQLFEGSKRLLELADDIEEIPTICWCGKKARFNARVVDGKVIKDGPQIVLGANESYVALCRKHYFLGQLE